MLRSVLDKQYSSFRLKGEVGLGQGWESAHITYLLEKRIRIKHDEVQMARPYLRLPLKCCRVHRAGGSWILWIITHWFICIIQSEGPFTYDWSLCSFEINLGRCSILIEVWSKHTLWIFFFFFYLHWPKVMSASFSKTLPSFLPLVWFVSHTEAQSEQIKIESMIVPTLFRPQVVQKLCFAYSCSTRHITVYINLCYSEQCNHHLKYLTFLLSQRNLEKVH